MLLRDPNVPIIGIDGDILAECCPPEFTPEKLDRLLNRSKNKPLNPPVAAAFALIESRYPALHAERLKRQQREDQPIIGIDGDIIAERCPPDLNVAELSALLDSRGLTERNPYRSEDSQRYASFARKHPQLHRERVKRLMRRRGPIVGIEGHLLPVPAEVSREDILRKLDTPATSYGEHVSRIMLFCRYPELAAERDRRAKQREQAPIFGIDGDMIARPKRVARWRVIHFLERHPLDEQKGEKDYNLDHAAFAKRHPSLAHEREKRWARYRRSAPCTKCGGVFKDVPDMQEEALCSDCGPLGAEWRAAEAEAATGGDNGIALVGLDELEQRAPPAGEGRRTAVRRPRLRMKAR